MRYYSKKSSILKSFLRAFAISMLFAIIQVNGEDITRVISRENSGNIKGNISGDANSLKPVEIIKVEKKIAAISNKDESLFDARMEDLKTGVIKKTIYLPSEKWHIYCHNGAEVDSRIEYDESGKPVLTVSKLNSKGLVSICPDQPLEMKLGTQYYVRLIYQSEDAPIDSMLLMSAGSSPHAEIFPGIADGIWLFANMAIRNSPADVWTKRVMRIECGNKNIQGGSGQSMNRIWPSGTYPFLLLYGNPCTIRVRELQFYPAAPWKSEKYSEIPRAYSREDVIKRLQSKNPSVLSVRMDNKHAVMFANEKTTAPTWFWRLNSPRDYREIVKNAPMPVTVTIPLGHAPFFRTSQTEDKRVGAHIWQGKGKYNFKALEENLLSILKQSPDIDLVVSLEVFPYADWIEENPNECPMNKDGISGYKIRPDYHKIYYSNTLPQGDKYYREPSLYSKKWREETSEAITAVIDWIKNSPYKNAVSGFALAGGKDYRFEPVSYDYHPDAEIFFQSWCREKYSSIEALSASWGKPYKDFSEVSLPRGKEAGGEVGMYIKDSALKDMLEFNELYAWELADYFSRSIKNAWGDPVFVNAYKSFNYDFSKRKYMDVNVSSIGAYGFKAPGTVAGWFAPRLFDEKMWVVDHDLRTWADETGACGIYFAEERDLLLSRAHTRAEFAAIHDKLTGNALAHRSAYMYFEMHDWFFNDADIIKHIESRKKIAKTVSERSAIDNFTPDVAVIVSPREGRMRSGGHRMDVIIHHLQSAQLQISGVPFDIILMDDLMARKDLWNYKVYVFMENVYLKSDERKFINEHLKNKNRTLVWVGDTGFISEKGANVTQMSDLIGMNVQTELDSPFSRLTALTIPGAPFTGKTERFHGDAELYTTALDPSVPDRQHIQPFWITDKSAVPMARYHENGLVAMAVKKFQNWTSVYLAPHCSLGGDILNNIAKEAGTFICAEPGQDITMNGNFLCLNAIKSGPCKFKLPPGRTKVVDAFTGKEIPVYDGFCQVNAVARNCYWYLLE